MANVLQPSFKQLLLAYLTSNTIKIALMDTGVYTYSSAHDFFDDVSAGVIGTPVTLASKTVTSGVFDAADPTFTAVTGASVESFWIYHDTGTPSTSPLIAYFDTVASGLPVTPNGGDISITFDNGANKIFAL